MVALTIDLIWEEIILSSIKARILQIIFQSIFSIIYSVDSSVKLIFIVIVFDVVGLSWEENAFEIKILISVSKGSENKKTNLFYPLYNFRFK